MKRFRSPAEASFDSCAILVFSGGENNSRLTFSLVSDFVLSLSLFVFVLCVLDVSLDVCLFFFPRVVKHSFFLLMRASLPPLSCASLVISNTFISVVSSSVPLGGDCCEGRELIHGR